MKRALKVLIAIIAVFVAYLILLSTGASVVSDSMSHVATAPRGAGVGDPTICGAEVELSGRLDFEAYWDACGNWYENRSITREEFSAFPFSDGIRKGDFVWYSRSSEIRVGDVVVSNQLSGRMLIHRVIEKNEDTYVMKMDANADSLVIYENPLRTQMRVARVDERTVSKEQIVGVVRVRLPLIGYPRAWLSDLAGR